jgi:hypothetical protein
MQWNNLEQLDGRNPAAAAGFRVALNGFELVLPASVHSTDAQSAEVEYHAAYL